MTPERVKEILAGIQRGEDCTEDEWKEIIEAAKEFPHSINRVIDEVTAEMKVRGMNK